MANPGAPEPSEYPSFFANYVQKAQPVADPAHKLAEQANDFAYFLRGLPDEKRLHRYAPDRWSIQEMLGHLIDTERIFAYRALRIARADATPLPGFEENAYVASAHSEAVPWDELVEEFETVRAATILLIKHFPEDAWLRMGTSSGQPISVRALTHVMIGHVEHHLDILRDRYL